MTVEESNARRARFDIRLSEEQKDIFERAAQLGGFGSLTDFVLITVQEKAKAIISERERIVASQRDSAIFFDTVMSQKGPNKKLSRAAKGSKTTSSR